MSSYCFTCRFSKYVSHLSHCGFSVYLLRDCWDTGTLEYLWDMRILRMLRPLCLSSVICWFYSSLVTKKTWLENSNKLSKHAACVIIISEGFVRRVMVLVCVSPQDFVFIPFSFLMISKQPVFLDGHCVLLAHLLKIQTAPLGKLCDAHRIKSPFHCLERAEPWEERNK